MSVDKDALYETLDRVIAAEAEGTWNQKTWVCGTSACFCGHRALMDRAEVVGVNHVRMPGGVAVDIRYNTSWEGWGRERFGLDDLQAYHLFNDDNTLEDLKEIVDRICSEAP